MPQSESPSRRKFLRVLILVGAIVVIGGLSVLHLYRRGSSSVQVQGRMIVGNQLRLLVDTYRMRGSGNYGHSSDRMGYYVTIDLDSSRSLADRTRIYGPVSGPSDQSWFTSLDNCLNYLAYSDQSLGPFCAFDQEGSLVRFTRDIASHVITRDALVIEAAGAHWQRQGESKPMEKYLYENNKTDSYYVATPSGRYVAMFVDGVATVFDRLTGERHPDQWLESVFMQIPAIRKLHDRSEFLTEDLSCLVVAPRETFIRTFVGGHDTFEFEGEVLSGGLAYSRGGISPTVIQSAKAESEEGGFWVIGNIFPLEKRAFLFKGTASMLRLNAIDRSAEFHIDTTDRTLWPDGLFFYTQHRADIGAITMLSDTGSDFKSGKKPGDNVTVVNWFYRENKVSTENIPIVDLFRRWNGQLYPKVVLPVR